LALRSIEYPQLDNKLLKLYSDEKAGTVFYPKWYVFGEAILETRIERTNCGLLVYSEGRKSYEILVTQTCVTYGKRNW
jgi:hypothetical protein